MNISSRLFKDLKECQAFYQELVLREPIDQYHVCSYNAMEDTIATIENREPEFIKIGEVRKESKVNFIDCPECGKKMPDTLDKCLQCQDKDYPFKVSCMPVERLENLRNLVKVHGQDGNWNASRYDLGLYNGLELALSVMEVRPSNSRDYKDMGLYVDEDTYKLLKEQVEKYRTMSNVNLYRVGLYEGMKEAMLIIEGKRKRFDD